MITLIRCRLTLLPTVNRRMFTTGTFHWVWPCLRQRRRRLQRHLRYLVAIRRWIRRSPTGVIITTTANRTNYISSNLHTVLRWPPLRRPLCRPLAAQRHRNRPLSPLSTRNFNLKRILKATGNQINFTSSNPPISVSNYPILFSFFFFLYFWLFCCCCCFCVNVIL